MPFRFAKFTSFKSFEFNIVPDHIFPELSQQSVASIPVEQPLTRFRDGGHTQRKHSTIPATCG